MLVQLRAEVQEVLPTPLALLSLFNTSSFAEP